MPGAMPRERGHNMSDKTYNILIAEDDPDIINILELYLQNAGYEVLTAKDGIDAWAILQTKSIDLCIFDIMMPRMNGYELIKKVRETSTIPILMLSAKAQDSDKIIGLDLGADDYISKPFNPLEVVARVRSNLRRSYKLSQPAASPNDDSILRIGDLCLDPERVRLTRGDREIPVTPTEFKILSLLMKHPGRVFTKVQIYEHINGEFFERDENTIMVHISNLRDKIEDDSHNPVYLKTVRGLGYKIENITEN